MPSKQRGTVTTISLHSLSPPPCRQKTETQTGRCGFPSIRPCPRAAWDSAQTILFHLLNHPRNQDHGVHENVRECTKTLTDQNRGLNAHVGLHTKAAHWFDLRGTSCIRDLDPVPVLPLAGCEAHHALKASVYP